MWIKAQDGKLYNSESFTTIEMKQNGSRFILMATQVAVGTHHINLQTCESEAEAEKLLDYLADKLSIVDVKDVDKATTVETPALDTPPLEVPAPDATSPTVMPLAKTAKVRKTKSRAH